MHCSSYRVGQCLRLVATRDADADAGAGLDAAALGEGASSRVAGTRGTDNDAGGPFANEDTSAVSLPSAGSA
jgi:hypothetical protein